jgi:hypothetical protein
MASPNLIVEDGSGIETADSLISVEYADTYHDLRGNAAWADLNERQKEQALRAASTYLQMTYDGLWKGTRTYDVQSMPWPRAGVYDSDSQEVADDVIPSRVQQATAEAALRHAANPGSLVPDLARGGKISSVSAGSVSVSYEEGASPYPVFGVLDRLLTPYLKNRAGGGVSVIFAQRA